MKIIKYRERMLQVPELIDEFTPAQYRRYLEISLLNDRGILSRPTLRSKLLTLLLDERTDLSMQREETIEEALNHIDLTLPFILPGEKRDRMNLNTGLNLLKEWDGWTGPGDMLDGVTFGAFIDGNGRNNSPPISAGNSTGTRHVPRLIRTKYSAPTP